MQPYRQRRAGTVRVQACQIHVRAESPYRAEQACRKGGGAGVQIPQPETAGKCHPGTDKGMGTQEADHRQGSRHHPQVHHLAERGAAQGSGIGEDILRLQAEAICPASA